jgi:hypothetical protein
MFVKKVFNWIRHFFHSSIYKKYSYMYSMTPNFFPSFLTYKYQKFAEFLADFKSMEIFGKKCTQKKLIAKYFCKSVV